MCTCEEIEKGTYACKASKLGLVERWWTQDGKLGITIQDPPPESKRQTHLLYFTYSYCILSRFWKFSTSLLVLCHNKHIFLFPMLILHVTSSWFCLYLLYFYHFTYTFSHAHTEAHTLKHTCIIRTQEEWRQPGILAWLKGAEEKLLLETTICKSRRSCAWVPPSKQKKRGKKCQEKLIFTNLKTKIQAHRASSKATKLFVTK